ncbi:MAG: diguanylate cyclase [Actinobacteria bacterium]|uniref:Unannotated protein n=1 Tax=freshwater metagenome TaxID=449393 RepID=A0A6J7IWZ8_9ZZZZ|nr:diguanylate cyclase [Actinomycetota bacterium]
MTAIVSEAREASTHRRGLVVSVVAAMAVVAALALGVQLVPAGSSTTWLAIVAVALLVALAAVALVRQGRVEAGAVVLLTGLAVSLALGPIIDGDLATTPFWLGPLCAIGLIVLPRGPRTPWILAGVSALVLVVLALIAGPSTFRSPSYLDLIVGGALVSLTTVVVASYGVWEHHRALKASDTLVSAADELLRDLESTRRELERRVAEREVALASVLSEQEELIVTLSDLAVRDPRTQLFNARHHKEQWGMVVDESRATGLPVSVIALDLDHFGQINKNYSHQDGDRVLEEFAALVRRLIRPGDIPYRLGQGEEFVVVLPHTRADEAAQVAERIRVACRKSTWNAVPQERLTVSAGVAERWPDSDDRWRDVLERADEALRGAKTAGRDQVRVSDSGGATS